MARVTIDQFAAKCCMERRALMVYIGRKKVEVEDGTIIDTNHEKNLLFYNKREAKGLITTVNGAPVPGAAAKPAKVPKAAAERKQIPRTETYIEPGTEGDEENGEGDDEDSGKDGILPLILSEKKKKHYEAIVQERTVTLKELDIQKKTGESVPTALVIDLMAETLRLFSIGYRDLYEREVQKIAAMAGFSAKEIADLRNSGINNINLIYSKAVEKTKSSIDSIIAGHSQKRGVGEKA